MEQEVIETNALEAFVVQNGLDKNQSQHILEQFNSFFNQAAEWEAKAKSLNVTDVSQVREMQMARTARLALRDIRTGTEKVRKDLKERSLREGKAIDGIANVIKALVIPIEEHLEKQEKFIELKEQERKEKLRLDRTEKLSQYTVDSGIYPLGEMSEQAFEDLIFGFKQAKLKREQEEKERAEAEIARQKAEAEERERIRIENERLKKEAEQHERQLAIERAKAAEEQKRHDELMEAQRKQAEAVKKKAEAEAKKIKDAAEAKLKAEREQREKAEAELKATQEKERQEKLAAEAARKKAAAAPDKNKLIELSSIIAEIEMPDMKTDEGKKILNDTVILLEKVCDFIKEKSSQL